MGDNKEKLRAMIRELGEAISNTLVESDAVQIVLKRIKEQGYHIDLSLAIGVGLYKEQQQKSITFPTAPEEDSEKELKYEINQTDLEFLNSLHITIDKKENQ